ncbi:MAG TPA: exonuclease domain-containing protein, partial [bacterium]|nr:exonuclease domain-containing protein [bacterium]
CEIALLRIKSGQVVEKFVTLVNPERELSFGAYLINHISPEMLASSPKFREIAPLVRNFLQKRTLLMHNAAFDLSFLKTQMNNCGLVFPETELVDTLELARRFFNHSSNALYSLAEELKINFDRTARHRAEPDAWMAYLILKHFLKDLKRSGIGWPDIVSSTARIDITLKVLEILPGRLAGALGKRKRVPIRYVEKDDRVVNREIEPVEVLSEHGVLYLLAYCVASREERKFRLDRIVEVMENIE